MSILKFWLSDFVIICSLPIFVTVQVLIEEELKTIYAGYTFLKKISLLQGYLQ